MLVLVFKNQKLLRVSPPNKDEKNKYITFSKKTTSIKANSHLRYEIMNVLH